MFSKFKEQRIFLQGKTKLKTYKFVVIRFLNYIQREKVSEVISVEAESFEQAVKDMLSPKSQEALDLIDEIYGAKDNDIVDCYKELDAERGLKVQKSLKIAHLL